MSRGGQRDLTYAERRARMRPRPFPLEPLALRVGVVLGVMGQEIDADSLATLAERLGVGYRHVKRMRASGLSVTQADRFALLLDLHPVLIWPEWDEGRHEPEPGPAPTPEWLSA